MKKIYSKIGIGFMVLGFLISMYICLFVRFTNPNLTETQLVLLCWKEIILSAASVLLGAVLFDKNN
ncbi:MAG: hypothetical protein OQK82_05630 [Candidatus Pacearchaeota archaeon]|nr:hypothetical protein [Candidatus Pacearchaeota archaeon]